MKGKKLKSFLLIQVISSIIFCVAIYCVFFTITLKDDVNLWKIIIAAVILIIAYVLAGALNIVFHIEKRRPH